MTDLEIGLTLTLAIFIVAIGVMFVISYHKIQMLKDENFRLGEKVKNLNQSLSVYKVVCHQLAKEKEISESHHKTEMSRLKYRKSEEIDDLRCRLAQKEQLLQQKWENAKK